MSSERLGYCLAIIIVLCITGLISQCSYSTQQCRQEAIKSGKFTGMDTEKIRFLCR